MNQTNERANREKEFHNQWANTIQTDELLVHESFESPTAIENRYILEQFGNLKGKKILDLGCGAGESSVYFALQGADVTGCDIAEKLLTLAKDLATKFGVKIQTAQADSARLPFPDETFDFVYGNGVLHHVEIIPTAQEICRVLKKGAKAAFIEPLPYNPLIEVYRSLAKGVRSQDERPVSFKQIFQMKPYFSSLDHKEFWLFSLLIFLHFFFIQGWHPSKVRYWKKVIEEGKNYEKLFGRLQKLDGFFLKNFPFLGSLCWNTVIMVVK